MSDEGQVPSESEEEFSKDRQTQFYTNISTDEMQMGVFIHVQSAVNRSESGSDTEASWSDSL